MVAVLAKIFGTENFELAEDVVQDALISALESWKFNGIPDNPRAWLYRTARNKAIDIIRKNKHYDTFDFSDPARKLLTSEYTLSTTMTDFWKDEQVQDDFLGMMYACCHPDISKENQVTFILKSLCGFSTKEVAKAFLASEDTISKRLYRTKEYFREKKIRPQLPNENELHSRTGAVLSSIYLMFNEGYNSTHSDQLIRKELIGQAMLLSKSLLENEKTRLPEVNALMALMCFHSARIESRTNSEGELIMLDKQDRSKWDQEMIKMGNMYMNRAAFGDRLTTYHLEAAISYQHCIAGSFAETDWEAILNYYDALLQLADDPIVHLNRCIALMNHQGAQPAFDHLNKITANLKLPKYYLYHAFLGELQERLGNSAAAVSAYQKAMGLTQSDSEQQFLRKKIEHALN